MQRKFMAWSARFLALSLIGGAVFLSSCDDDEEEAKENTPNFEYSVSQTYKTTAPSGISVTFTDMSENVSARSWNFGDGSEESTDVSPVHVYRVPGNYTVELTTAAAPGVSPATAKKSVEVTVTDPTASMTNLIQGGQFETADANKWTVLYSGQKTVTNNVKTFNHVDYAFGSAKNLPAGSQGGVFHIQNSLAGQEAGSVFYQSVNLTPGVYRFSFLMRHDAEDRNGANGVALKEYWFETYISKRMPTFDENEAQGNDNGYNDQDPTPDGQPGAISGFIYNAWTGRAASTDYPATNGLMPFVGFGRKARTRADDTGVFTIAADQGGTYYVVFKAGKGGNGGFGTNGISIENMRLVKLQ